MTIDSGIEHVKGDMFVSVPKGDAIFLKVRKLKRYGSPVIVINSIILPHILIICVLISNIKYIISGFAMTGATNTA